MNCSEVEEDGLEVTCPVCAQTRVFLGISGPDGAGTWLLEHQAFHHYELVLLEWEQSYGVDVFFDPEGGE